MPEAADTSQPLKKRQDLFARIEEARGGRSLVSVFNFDRECDLDQIGVSSQFNAECKEALFRVLKESKPTKGIDLCLYTRGGDTNSVWPLVNLLREFDSDFQVLAPFRCHSAGTLLSLGARRIIMTPLSELSPVDPSTGNQFNPIDPQNKNARLGIAVEDVSAYGDFLHDFLSRGRTGKDKEADESLSLDQRLAWVQPLLAKLAENIHPLALGNVHRVHQQVKNLAGHLLRLHPLPDGKAPSEIVHAFTTRFNSHLHMISRHEAKEILGDRVEFASDDLASLLDLLLRSYEDIFDLRRPFIVAAFMEDEPRKEFRCISGSVESRSWSYLYETRGVVTQYAVPPQNIQVQVPMGQTMPLLPGLPRSYNLKITTKRWTHNTEPKGITR